MSPGRAPQVGWTRTVDRPTSRSGVQARSSRGRRLPGIREPAGCASPDRPRVGPLQRNEQPDADPVGAGRARGDEASTVLRKQSGRRAAPHQLKTPVPPPPAPVAGRPAWAEGALCIKATVTSRGARAPGLRRRGLAQGAGPAARRPGNPSCGGGAQVAPPTQGKGQVAVAVSANGRTVGASVGGACPGAQLLQRRIKEQSLSLLSWPARCSVTVWCHYSARFRQHCLAQAHGPKACQTLPQPTTSWSLICLASVLPTTFVSSLQAKAVHSQPKHQGTSGDKNWRTRQKGFTTEIPSLPGLHIIQDLNKAKMLGLKRSSKC